MDWALYWFMFPVSILVSVAATASGIGGPALFTPIYLLGFPVLGTALGVSLNFGDPVMVFTAGLITATFGCASGVTSYLHAGLVDVRTAFPLICVAVPSAVFGVVYAHHLDANLLKTAYAVLMVALAVYIVGFRRRPFADEAVSRTGRMRTIQPRRGEPFSYPAPKWYTSMGWAGIGGVLTGVVSVGIGEVLVPQFAKRRGIPVPVAAATSVLVVTFVFLAASLTHVWRLAGLEGDAIPWNLLVYTVPGVIIGAQIGPRLQGRIGEERMVWVIGLFFVFIGVAMGSSVWIGI